MPAARWREFGLCAFAVAAGAVLCTGALQVHGQAIESRGVVTIGKRALKCGSVPVVFDANLPIEGEAVMGQAVVLNPVLLHSHPEVVRLFIYAHECGHHAVGASEHAADCYAAKRGVAEGWLDEPGTGEVCRSLGDDPATDTHPSAKSRCKALKACYAKAAAALPAKPPTPAPDPAEPPQTETKAFRLAREPQLVGAGVTSAAPAKAPTRADAIGDLIGRLGVTSR